MDRRGFLKGAGQVTVAGAVAAAMHPARALIGMLGGAPSGAVAKQPGILNVNAPSNFDPQIMFLNAFKSASGGYGYHAWQTADSSGNETNEEAYLPQILDSDGYAKSLTLTTAPNGGQKFTTLVTVMFVNMPTAPTATYPYPAGQRLFQWQGKCTFLVGSQKGGTDASVVAGSGSAGVTITGNTVSTSNAWGTVNSVLIDVPTPSTNGVYLTITALPDSLNYFKDASLVETAYTSLYDGGQVYHPLFLAFLQSAPPSIVRFMDATNTNNQVLNSKYQNNYFTLTASPLSGAVSATLAQPWQSQAGTWAITLSNGQTLNGTFTAGGTTVSFGTAVSSNCPNNQFYTTCVFASNPTAAQPLPALTGPWVFPGGTMLTTLASGEQISITFTTGSATVSGANPTVTCTATNFWTFGYENWSGRPQTTNFSYGFPQSGVPYEECIALANLLGADAWLNIPACFQSADWASFTSMCQANISGHKVAVEWQNEVWNSGFQAYSYAQARQSFLSKSDYYGYIVGTMLDEIKTTAGTSYSNDFIGIVGGLAGDNTPLISALTTTDLSPPLWQRGTVGGAAVAPYIGNGPLLAADYTYLEGLADPTGTFIDFLTANPVGGYNMTAEGQQAGYLPSGGWIGICVSQASSAISALASYGSIPLYCYEGGWGFTDYHNAAGQEALLISATRDSRITTPYQSYFQQIRNLGAVPAQFNFCYAIQPSVSAGGYQWGLIESVMQTESPLASTPAKWQAWANYING